MLLGVDVGGTFTDAVLVTADGSLHTAKVPSTPAEQSLAVMEAVQLVLDLAGAEPAGVRRFAHGMTVATNALLEGHAARTALIATDGFTDVIELARQNRPHLYRLCDAPPKPLVDADLRFGALERMGPEGVLSPLDASDARALVARVAAARPQAVAVSLLHSYRDPAHERQLGALLEELLPDASLSLSSELVGTFREYERTATTVLDAALSPLLASYLRRLANRARSARLPEPEIMQSSGGLTDVARASAHAALTVLSGPAGGVAGALLLSELCGEPNTACFDMGGTSCDVCLIEQQRVPETAERQIAGRPVALPALDIHTVGAGGGSIAWRDDGGALRVGPASAGAHPGPACYGRGGSAPTVTDANLLLGRLLDDTPLPGGLQLDRRAALGAVSHLARQLNLEPLACADGIVRVAEAEMLGALRVITVERGIDPRNFALMPFGGAGPLHAAALARQLGISRILCPRASGVLCALGLAAAAPRRDAARTLMLRGRSFSDQALEAARRELVELAVGVGDPHDISRLRFRFELRYAGQSFELPVEHDLEADSSDSGVSVCAARHPGAGALREQFASAHELRYGYRDEHAEVELVNLRVSAWGHAPSLRTGAAPASASASASASGAGVHNVTLDGRPHAARLYRGELPAGATVEGPALCAMPQATLLVPPGWRGEVDAHGTVVLHDREAG